MPAVAQPTPLLPRRNGFRTPDYWENGMKPQETRWDARLYDYKHSFVWKHGTALLELLAAQAGERILDLGCGTGHLTAQIAATGAAVLGIDTAPAMIDEARRTYPALTFLVGDARDFAFPEPFDAVFSNAVLHWIKEPERVLACIYRALRPEGRFVAEFGGKGNVRRIGDALLRTVADLGFGPIELPWYYPSVGEYAGLLEKHGLEVIYAILFDRPTPLEGEAGLRHWIEMFAHSVLKIVPEEQRSEFLRRVEEQLRPQLHRNGTWIADYRRLRVVARRSP
jgi:trans-aconitate methyltransferase